MITKPIRSFLEYTGNPSKGLDIVHDSGMTHESGVHGKRRAISRLTSVSFQRFDQRGLLAAYICACAHAYFYIEIETIHSFDFASHPMRLNQLVNLCLQM